MTDEDPWEAAGGPAADALGEGGNALRGIPWAMVHDVAAAPLRTQPTIMRMASALVREPAMTSTPQALAKRLKVTEVAVMEAASRMPTLFALQAGGHRKQCSHVERGPGELVKQRRHLIVRQVRQLGGSDGPRHRRAMHDTDAGDPSRLAGSSAEPVSVPSPTGRKVASSS